MKNTLNTINLYMIISFGLALMSLLIMIVPVQIIFGTSTLIMAGGVLLKFMAVLVLPLITLGCLQE